MVGSRADVAADAFRALETWGYTPIGHHPDPRNHLEVVAYSSKSATVWVVFFHDSLTVVVSPTPESDPSRLNHHLAARGEAGIAIWGAFPVQARHLPAAAREFLRVGERLLRGGSPNFGRLSTEMDAAALTFSRAIALRENWAAAQELARDGYHRAAIRILAYWERELAPEQRALLERERQAAASEPSPIERDGRSDRDWFIARADHLTAMDRQLMDSAKDRDRSPEAAAAHQIAAVRYHDAKDFLYDDLDQAIARCRAGDTAATEYLVTFLEADVWCFRSGYMKGRLYELMRQVVLDEAVKTRLRSILLRLVDVGYRLEFRSACRLARQIANARLITDVRGRLHGSPDPHVRRRALWMLGYITDGLQSQDRDAVLDLVLDTAGDKDWYRVSTWVQQMCRRFSDDAFAAKVRGLALSTDETNARVGLRLLRCAIREPLDPAERRMLEPIIIDAVHERGPGAHLMEGLAAVADTRRLRARLAELAQHAQSPVNRYAQWALNSAVRANGEQSPDL